MRDVVAFVTATTGTSTSSTQCSCSTDYSGSTLTNAARCEITAFGFDWALRI